MKRLRELFFTMLKIGLFTFGGGYAMIALLERELIEKKNWIPKDEFLDMVAIAESTPGPIAVNAATYVGYRRQGVPGAAVATLGVCLPSFGIIYLISLFFHNFLSFETVTAAFQGIRVCVIYLILSAGIRLLKQVKRDALHLGILLGTMGAMVGFSLLSSGVSSIMLILLSGCVGLSGYFVRVLRERRAGK